VIVLGNQGLTLEIEPKRPPWLEIASSLHKASRPSTSSSSGGSRQKLAMTELMVASSMSADVQKAQGGIELAIRAGDGADDTANHESTSSRQVDALMEPLSQTVAALALEGLE
jgi:hypothetical protein